MRGPLEIDAEYLAVGAGAMGMAFADALASHSDATVAIVDRRVAPGGHWLDAYPFVRLHQASSFYGVASTRLGSGALQQTGPERGLHERATAPEICAYYGSVLTALERTGRVQFHPACEYRGGGRFVSMVSGTAYHASRARVVDGTYLSPTIPSRTPPPFLVDDGVSVIPVNDLARISETPPQFVLVGAGKTAMDAGVWLLQRGVDPSAICWVRPRDPWVYDRTVVQPDPAVFLGMAADTMAAAREATSADDLFLRMEDAGIMLRLDRRVLPTMAKTPTIGRWEVALLSTITDVVRQGHLRRVSAGRLHFDAADVRIDPHALVVHCAASGLRYAPLVPIWQPDAIRPRPVRVGFPCFGAALSGYVEATRDDDDDERRGGPDEGAHRPGPRAPGGTDGRRLRLSRAPDRCGRQSSAIPAHHPGRHLRSSHAVRGRGGPRWHPAVVR